MSPRPVLRHTPQAGFSTRESVKEAGMVESWRHAVAHFPDGGEVFVESFDSKPEATALRHNIVAEMQRLGLAPTFRVAVVPRSIRGTLQWWVMLRKQGS